MAGKCFRTYSRKKSTAPPISQFDKLISEHGKSTHPVASKTAGHVGKWGMTSFTSLRSISETYGKEDGVKRTWIDSPPASGTQNLLSGTADQVIEETKPVVPSKKRKFFKSRDCNNVNSVQPTHGTKINDNKQCESHDIPQNCEDSLVHKFSKHANSSHKNTENYHSKSQKTNSGLSCMKSSSGGGIKLKIFKSRNSDLNSYETYSSTVQLPSDDSGSCSNSSSVTNSPRSDPNVNTEMNSCHSPNGLILQDSQPVKSDVDSVQSQRDTLNTDDYDNLSVSLALNELNKNQPPLPGTLELPEKSDDNQQVEFPISSSVCTSPIDQSDFFLNTSSAVNSCESNSVQSDSTVTLSDIKKVSVFNCEDRTERSEPEERMGSREPSPACKESHADKEMDLFSTDFDENEIVDRTSIEYPSSSSVLSDPQNTQSSTIDLDDMESSQPLSYPNLRSNSYPKTLSQEFEPAKASTLTKKRSIFKSRQKEGEPKKRATYKHKWHGPDDKDENLKPDLKKSNSSVTSDTSGDPFEFNTTPVLKRVQTWPATQTINDSMEEETPVTTVKCPKLAKKYYTVIKNVKKTHQLQESGEFQEFNDDVEYFLDALKSSNSVSTRCLASLNLAQKCMTPAFRMHLRAHATVIKFFRALSDAPAFPQLAECAAMVMFALSQDRLNMDLDKGSLEMMLNLLDTDSTVNDSSNQLSDAAAAEQNSKIRVLCQELQQKGHAKHLNLDNINASTLAMETLLSLTSKRAGEWFKEELRELGGVDHLVRTVTSYCKYFQCDIQIWTASLLDKLSKIDRCLKVLENVTHQNESNQEYLLSANGGGFSGTLMQLFRMCHREVPLNPMHQQNYVNLSCDNPAASKVIIKALITTIKVLINLTHGSHKEALGSQILGRSDEIYNISIYCLLIMPMYLDHDTKFEIQVLACCLLLNLVENSLENRQRLMDLKSPVAHDSEELFEKQEGAMASLVTLFYTSEESARIQEAHTDQIIDKDLVQEITKEEEKKDEDIEETVARLLQKAGRHMEDTLIAAYTALIAGYCMIDNKEYEERIRLLQPQGHFKTMVTVLKKFMHFMNLTATTALLRSLKPTERVVKHMERLDRTPEEEAEEKRKKEEAVQAMAFEAFGF